MTIRERFVRSAHACCYRMYRRKRHPTDQLAFDTRRYHSVFDILNIGLGSVIAMAAFVFVAPLAAHVTGPSIIVSLAIAVLAGVMSGVCFLEMKSSLPKTPSTAYEYTFYVIGEAAAFCVGWMTLLRHVTAASASARMLSASVDSLLGGNMLNVTLEKIGDIQFLNSHVDPMAALIVVCFVATATMWSRDWSMHLILALTNVATVVVVVVVLTVGIANSRLQNWEPFVGFFSHGLNGVLQGAAVLFCAFAHTESQLTSTFASGTTKTPLSIAVTLGHVIVTTVVLSLSGIVTLLSPVTWVQEATLTTAFDARWVCFLIAAMTLLALGPFLLTCFLRAADTQQAMTSDGLLPGGDLHSGTRRITTAAAFSIGGLAALAAGILSVVNLIQLLACCTLVGHVFLCLSLVVVQHKPADQLGIRLKNRYLVQPTIGATWRSTETTVSYIALFSSDYGATQLHSDGSYDAAANVTLPRPESQTDAHLCQLERHGSSLLSTPTSVMEPDSSSSSSDTDIDDVVGEYRESERIRCRRHFRDAFPSISTYRYTFGATATLCVCSVCAGLVARRGSALDFRHPDSLALSLFGLLAVTLALSAGVVAAMPTNRLSSSASVVGTARSRWTPLACMFVHMVLATSLPVIVLLQAAGWLALGAASYAVYGTTHSRLAAGEQQDEHRILLLARRVSTPMSDTIHSPGGATS